MKVHANTISHARLVALEETFPRTLAAIGHDRFNDHSRSYAERAEVTGLSMARIGVLFPQHLERCGVSAAAADLSRFEWLWLGAYHAVEAPTLRLADLASIAPEQLMDIAVAAHPAASLDRFDHEVNRLIGVEVPGLADAHAILLTRPEAQVLVFPATAAMRAIFSEMQIPDTIGNFLVSAREPDSEEQIPAHDFMAALIALIEAGALVPAHWQQVA